MVIRQTAPQPQQAAATTNTSPAVIGSIPLEVIAGSEHMARPIYTQRSLETAAEAQRHATVEQIEEFLGLIRLGGRAKSSCDVIIEGLSDSTGIPADALKAWMTKDDDFETELSVSFLYNAIDMVHRLIAEEVLSPFVVDDKLFGLYLKSKGEVAQIHLEGDRTFFDELLEGVQQANNLSDAEISFVKDIVWNSLKRDPAEMIDQAIAHQAFVTSALSGGAA